MQYKEMLDKTCCLLVGIVKGLNEYVNAEKKSYWSVDLEVKGTKMPVNVRLPDGFERSKLVEYEIAKFQCVIKPSFDKKGIVLEASGLS